MGPLRVVAEKLLADSVEVEEVKEPFQAEAVVLTGSHWRFLLCFWSTCLVYSPEF